METYNKPMLIKDLGTLLPKPTSKIKRRYGLFKCHCGNEFKAQTTDVKSGHTKSCGCYQKKIMSEIKNKYNTKNNRLYRIYGNIKTRCYNKNFERFEDYGAKGIKLCDKWLNSFEAFRDWSLNNGYKDNLSIDRIDNNKGYEPSNCRWTTQFIQSQNTRKICKVNTSGYRGVHKVRNKWKATIRSNGKFYNLGMYDCRIAAAYAYDDFININKTKHATNF